MGSNFVHLHLHDQYSVLDGLGKAEDYCKRAKELGMSAIALTNHGNVDGCIRFQKECSANEIKPIFGVEAYIVPNLEHRPGKGEKEFRHHITLLAVNYTGWTNILKMLTVANINGFYKRPRIDFDLLLNNCEGLAVGSACTSTYLKHEYGPQLLSSLLKKGCLCYGEIMPLNLDEQRKVNQLVIQIAIQYGIPVVATNDCHYVEKDDAMAHEVFLAMQTKVKWSDPNRWKLSVDSLYFQSQEEMTENFRLYSGVDKANYEIAINNSAYIASMCNTSLDAIEVKLPDVNIPKYKGMDPKDQLFNLVMDGYEIRKSKHPHISKKENEYLDRLAEELGIINTLGFAAYFLIVYELINWCKYESVLEGVPGGIMTGPGRGSVGGSLVAYCLGITQADPLLYDLVFSRFISEARIDFPDIDMDFERRYREHVIKHLKDMYGEYNVIGITNFSKMKGKSAVRNVSRVFEIPNVDVKKACDAIITRSGGDMRSDFSVADAFETFEDGKNFMNKYPVVAKMAMKMEGLVMGYGRHAAGICVSRYDLRSGNMMNFALRANNLVSNWDKKDIEHQGLMKLDILGLVSLDVLHYAKDMIRRFHGVEIDYDTIPLDDAKVIAEFNSGNCIGIFQFNGNSIMRFCKDIGINNFEEIVAMNALHRPGTLKSGTIHDYKDRKHGKVQFTYQHPLIEDITKNTFGIIVYQEQVMRLMYECGGLPWRTTDTIRKAVSKSQGEKQLDKFKDQFIEGCLAKNTLSREEADTIFEVIKTFGSYGFNKAHAVEYSIIAYWMMWLKVYYPTEFMCSQLSIGNEQKKSQIIEECRRLGLKFHLPFINFSAGTDWLPATDGGLIIPLSEIKGLGPKAVEEIISARETGGPFADMLDFENRINKRVVNTKIRRLLVECTCFSNQDIPDFSEAELDVLSRNFNFSLSNDPMYKYRKIMQLIKKSIPVHVIRKINGGGDLVWGYVDQITYQIKASNETEVSYSGCYGQLKDEELNYIMINFDRDLYKRRKDEIEHAQDQWIIGRVGGKRHDSMTITDIWFADDLLKGKMENLSIWIGSHQYSVRLAEYIQAAAKDIHVIENNEELHLAECTACELIHFGKAPVYPSIGKYNGMIIGEAPGFNSNGEVFNGNIGRILWTGDRAKGCIGLNDYGVGKHNTWVTSFVKCNPGNEIKTPKKKHIKACEKWWRKEVDLVRPFVILAFGNVGLEAITGEGTGIMEKSGTVSWNDELGCFVVHCINPGATLYYEENVALYNKGIFAFLELFLNVGFGTV